MAIGNVVQRGYWIYVYDEKGSQITAIGGGNEPGDGLTGYTSSTVNVRRGYSIYTYDDKGQMLTATTAR
jgi:hypothetical protein